MIEYNNNSILLRILCLDTRNAHLHYILGTNFDYLTIMLPESLKLCISGFFYATSKQSVWWCFKTKPKQKILLLHQTHLSPLLPPARHNWCLYSLHMMIVKWPVSRCTLCPTLTNCHSIFFCVARASLFHLFLFIHQWRLVDAFSSII